MASSIRTFVGPHVELPNCPWTIPFFQASFVFLWDCKQTVSPFTNSGRSFTSVCSGMPASFCFFLFLSSRTPSASCGCRSLSLVSYDSPDLVLDCPLCLARARFSGQGAWAKDIFDTFGLCSLTFLRSWLRSLLYNVTVQMQGST